MGLSHTALTPKGLGLTAPGRYSSAAQQLHPPVDPSLTLQTEGGVELKQTTGSPCLLQSLWRSRGLLYLALIIVCKLQTFFI